MARLPCAVASPGASSVPARRAIVVVHVSGRAVAGPAQSPPTLRSCRSSSQRAGPAATASPQPPDGVKVRGLPRFQARRSISRPMWRRPPRSRRGQRKRLCFQALSPTRPRTGIDARLARYSCTVMVMLITLRWGDAKPNGEVPSEQNCTPPVRYTPLLRPSARRATNRHEKSPAPKCGAKLAFVETLCSAVQALHKAP